MDELITREGAYEFLDLTLQASERRLIDGPTLRERLFALRELIAGDWEARREFAGERLVYQPLGEGGNSSEESGGHSALSGLEADPDVVALRLVLSQDPDLRIWDFRLGDPDPRPSVPHGHRVTRPMHKLDVYQGYVFEARTVVSRIRRREIARLWNNLAFRAFARRALEHFIQHNPAYQFPVRNPLRLPRRRKR